MSDTSANVVVVKFAYDAWSRAMDRVKQAKLEYDLARSICKDTIGRANLCWSETGKIEHEKKASGEPHRLDEWRQEYEDVSEIQFRVEGRIDELNEMKFDY